MPSAMPLNNKHAEVKVLQIQVKNLQQMVTKWARYHKIKKILCARLQGKVFKTCALVFFVKRLGCDVASISNQQKIVAQFCDGF